MIRARFLTAVPIPASYPDYPHPFWQTAHSISGQCRSAIVAYADGVDQIKANWPDVESVDVFASNLTAYEFCDRFPAPRGFSTQSPSPPPPQPKDHP